MHEPDSTILTIIAFAMSNKHTALVHQQECFDIAGEDYVAATKEVFYIRERPVAPQPVDGVIRSPVADGTQREWHDAFKIVYKGRDLTLLDLPSKEPILHIKKVTAAA